MTIKTEQHNSLSTNVLPVQNLGGGGICPPPCLTLATALEVSFTCTLAELSRHSCVLNRELVQTRSHCARPRAKSFSSCYHSQHPHVYLNIPRVSLNAHACFMRANIHVTVKRRTVFVLIVFLFDFLFLSENRWF